LEISRLDTARRNTSSFWNWSTAGHQGKKVLHLIVDNASSHDTKKVHEFFAARPGRFVVHFTPTHSSWLNLVKTLVFRDHDKAHPPRGVGPA